MLFNWSYTPNAPIWTLYLYISMISSIKESVCKATRERIRNKSERHKKRKELYRNQKLLYDKKKLNFVHWNGFPLKSKEIYIANATKLGFFVALTSNKIYRTRQLRFWRVLRFNKPPTPSGAASSGIWCWTYAKGEGRRYTSETRAQIHIHHRYPWCTHWHQPSF